MFIAKDQATVAVAFNTECIKIYGQISFMHQNFVAEWNSASSYLTDYHLQAFSLIGS